MITVKICGINDAAAAAAAREADMVGFVFYPPSPRAVTPEAAAALAAALPARIKRAGVFVDPDDETLARVLAAIPLDLLQLHGDETPARVAVVKERFGRAVIKALRVAEGADLDRAREFDGIADWLLFDARPPKRPGALPGGNATAFDWRLLQGRRFATPWLLSGGLTPETVAEAIRISGAGAVDVSSGVEDAPGRKSAAKIAAFIAAARDASLTEAAQ